MSSSCNYGCSCRLTGCSFIRRPYKRDALYFNAPQMYNIWHSYLVRIDVLASVCVPRICRIVRDPSDQLTNLVWITQAVSFSRTIIIDFTRAITLAVRGHSETQWKARYTNYDVNSLCFATWCSHSPLLTLRATNWTDWLTDSLNWLRSRTEKRAWE